MPRIVLSKNDPGSNRSLQPKSAPRRGEAVNGGLRGSAIADAQRSNEDDLARAALLYAVDCAVAGDAAGLRDLGLDETEVALLRSLTLEELRQVSSLCGPGLTVRFDAGVVRRVVRHVESVRRGEALQGELIRLDAPRAMMRALFGMGGREYARLRKRWLVTAGVGRPADLGEAAEHRLWHALSARLGAQGEEGLSAEHYLALQAETGAPLRAIWSLARRWPGR